ncbi:hypothetical protein CsatB_007258 [Cannabis sativa]
MDSIMCVVKYGRQWKEDKKYEDYIMTGLLIPTNCDLKISESPLCITTVDETRLQVIAQQKPESESVRQDTDVQKLILQITNQPTYDCMEYDDETSEISEVLALPNIFQVADSVADCIIEKTLEQKRKRQEEEREIITDHKVFNIEKGQIYKDRKILKTAVGFFAMINNFQFKTKRSEPREYMVTCADDNCNWFLRASKLKSTSTFKVRKYVQDHNCSLDIVMGDHKQANCNMIAEMIKKKFLSIKRNHRPNDIMIDMIDDFGVSMSYQKAWRAREKALELARGKQDESYQQLPKYLHMLKVVNPGTIAQLETDKKDRFKYLYLALANSIEGWKHCRPVIVTDRTFLKTSFGGTLFTASTMDANNNIFILAFGIGDSENDCSWECFFTKLRETFEDREDRHKSIEKAVINVYPNRFHGACIFHLLNNIKTNFGVHGDDLTINFVKAAKTYNLTSFERYMEEIDRIDKRIRPYLEKIGHEVWTRSHCPTIRYTMMTSNIAESINSVILAERSLPITTMIECFRSLVQKWVCKNGNEAHGIFTEVASDAEKLLRDNLLKAMKYQVIAITTIQYQVKVQEKGDFTINILERTCSCRRFQLDEIPCSHAIAVFAKRGLRAYDYVADYYKIATMKATYERTVHPLPNEREWTIPESIERIVWPPKSRKPARRPRKKRLRSKGEPKVVLKFTRCGKVGHN